jgi:hypothetical protein
MPEARDEFLRLAEKLLRSGVAPRHVRRLVEELEHHLAALQEEETIPGKSIEQARASARERLGSDELLLRCVTARPQLLSWGVRQPFLTCALAPLMALVITAVAFLLLAAASIGTAHLIYSSSSLQGGPPALIRAAFELLLALVTYVAPIACCAILAWYAATRRVKLGWAWVGIGLTAVLGATWNLNLHWAHGVERGSIGAGIGFSTTAPALAAFAARCLSAIAAAMLVPFVQRRISSSDDRPGRST